MGADLRLTLEHDVRPFLLNPADIPQDFVVRPLVSPQQLATAKTPMTCLSCGLTWDDGVPTSWTPVPTARCPFEYFHRDESLLETFKRGYINGMLAWATDENDKPLEDRWDPEDLSADTRGRVHADCAAFLEKAANICFEEVYLDANTGTPPAEMAGSDFWLTRNGHLFGFTPAEWVESAALQLAEIARSFGPLEPYVEYDGKIHFYA